MTKQNKIHKDLCQWEKEHKALRRIKMELPDFDVVGRNLQRIKKERKYSIPQMAYLTDIPLNSLRGYMFCTSYPTSKQLQKMAKGLKINIEDLFKEET